LLAGTQGDVEAGLNAMGGVIRQRPSAVSAIKVDGRRSYDRVRAGEEVDLPEREVEVAEIVVGPLHWTGDHLDVDVSVTCSTGTYIRAIARDLGEALGVGGHLTALRRTRVGPFGLDESVGIDDIASGLMTMDAVAPRCFPILVLNDQQSNDARHGRPQAWPGPVVSALSEAPPHALVDASGSLLALARPTGTTLSYVAVFAHD
jgi:tRNA pseudouridine55 synthase